MCIQPCGHTFCVSCTKKITNRCFVCNGSVTAKFKMYVSGRDDDEVVLPSGSGGVEPANTTRNTESGLIGQLSGLGQRI